MKSMIATTLMLALATAASAQEMVINRAAEQASSRPPAQHFTGNVRVAPLFAERCSWKCLPSALAPQSNNAGLFRLHHL